MPRDLFETFRASASQPRDLFETFGPKEIKTNIPMDTEISAARSPLKFKARTPEDIARDQNIGSIARFTGKRISDVEKEYEGKTAETGLRRTADIGMTREPTSKQLVEGIATPFMQGAMAAGLATAPISTAVGLGVGLPVFKGFDIASEKAIGLLPKETPRELKELAGTAGFAGSLYAGGKVLDKGRNIKLIKPKAPTKFAEEATGEYRAMLRPTQGEVKNVEIRKGKNIDDYYRLAAEEQLPIKQTPDKKLDTSIARDMLSKKQSEIAGILSEKLKSDQAKKFDLLTIGEKAKQELKGSIKNATEYKKSAQEIDQYIADEIESNGRVVNAETLNAIKQGMWSVGYDALRPTAKSNARKIGFIAKETIESAFPDANIKQLNELTGKYATLSDLLENAQGRVVQGGRLGKYFARTIGAVAGSGVPIIGPMAGQYLGGKASEFIAAPERMSKIASKKAQKAGIVGKSYKDVINYQPVITPELVEDMPISKQRLLPLKREQQRIPFSGQRYLQTDTGKGEGFTVGDKPSGFPINLTQKRIEQTIAKQIGLTPKEIKLLPPSDIKYGEGFTIKENINKNSPEVQRLKAFLRKGAGESQLKEAWSDLVRSQTE